ncbi:tRNA glutamyl-Q(34) synthetase GluQRS [Haematomicrobium sanguinis]|uniref:tRNA glutamyl-Q(34) synthetase GluQRS n=1 Tax=Haematomicrobium sanguinis TaxID=479106 RepID=UPI000479C8AF|nr:tRNA glutamyl-Q(34) synthetase GluQRS [Haematomicrobium sanguinis]
MAGRYAPSPTGNLHVGNLRTAILAWLFARSTGRDFLLRIEDLDRVRAGSEAQQIRELTDIGLDWDGTPARQSERLALYEHAIDSLTARGLTFECFCTRRDIAEAASAPHALPGHYPGTCRDLSDEEREERRRSRPSALRLRSRVNQWAISDLIHGEYEGAVDDFVIRRNDGAPAYNLAVVVDDHAQGVDQVVRGDDLLSSTPRQAYLGSLLGYPAPEYAHVPLALNADGQRLAKRDGAVTLEDLASIAVEPHEVRALILDSLGLPNHSLSAALAAFDPGALPREPWVVSNLGS